MYLVQRLGYFKALVFPISLFIVLLLFGTIGYMIIEGYSFLEAFYMTVITVALSASLKFIGKDIYHCYHTH